MRYRIWDELNELYTREIIVDQDGELHVAMFTSEIVTLGTPMLDRYTIERSTGLFDKNGKEIYEGDVCLFGEVSPIKDSVVYDNREAMFGLKGTSDILQQFVEGTKYPLEDKRAEVHIEVIGNIHEKEVE